MNVKALIAAGGLRCELDLSHLKLYDTSKGTLKSVQRDVKFQPYSYFSFPIVLIRTLAAEFELFVSPT